MKKVLFIAAGGCAGAILRYVIGEAYLAHITFTIPLNTLLINAAGCFLLSFILTGSYKLFERNTALKSGITTGFLGAFTTFSTLCRETTALFYAGNAISAVLYVIISVLLGFSAAYLGFIVSGLINANKRNRVNKHIY